MGDSGVACDEHLESCFIGFRWLRDQSATGSALQDYATTGLLASATVTPRCVEVRQGSADGHFAKTLSVQYWRDLAWQNHTIVSTEVGGLSRIRLPLVPLSAAR